MYPLQIKVKGLVEFLWLIGGFATSVFTVEINKEEVFKALPNSVVTKLLECLREMSQLKIGNNQFPTFW